MARTTRRMGKKKVIFVIDQILVDKLDELVREFRPEERAHRSMIVEEILTYVLEDENLVNEIFPDDWIERLIDIKDRLLKRFKGTRKRKNKRPKSKP